MVRCVIRALSTSYCQATNCFLVGWTDAWRNLMPQLLRLQSGVLRSVPLFEENHPSKQSNKSSGRLDVHSFAVVASPGLLLSTCL